MGQGVVVGTEGAYTNQHGSGVLCGAVLAEEVLDDRRQTLSDLSLGQNQVTGCQLSLRGNQRALHRGGGGVRLSHDGGQLVELAQRGCRDAGGDTCRGALRQGNRGGRLGGGCRLCYRCCRCSLSGSLGGGRKRYGSLSNLSCGGHLNDLELSDLLSGLFLNAGSLRSGTGGAHCGSCGKSTSQAGCHRCALSGRLNVYEGRFLGGRFSGSGGGFLLGQQFRVVQERGQGGFFGALCDRLFCSFFNGLGAVQGEGLCDHGSGSLLLLDSRNFLSRCFLSVQLLLSVGNDGCQGGFHIFAGLIRVLGGYLGCLSGRLFSLLSLGLYGSRTEDRVVLVIVLELSLNRRKLSLVRLDRLVGSFNSFLYVFLLLRRSSRTSHCSTSSGKTCSSQQTRGGALFSSLNDRIFRSYGSCLSLVRSLLLSEFSLQLTLDSLTLSLNRVSTLNSSFLSLLLRSSLSSLSGCNGLSLDSGALQQEALTGGLAVRHTQVGCVNLQAVT